jgi:hypothetical protein
MSGRPAMGCELATAAPQFEQKRAVTFKAFPQCWQ